MLEKFEEISMKILMWVCVLVWPVVILLLILAPYVQASDENGDTFCLAKNIYFEAGNQPTSGQIAVSQVVLNRVYSDAYPDTICDVVYQANWLENWKGNMIPIRHQCQFSWFCDGKSDVPEDSDTWMYSLLVADSILNGDFGDITEGSTHYHADYVHPYWADHMTEVIKIGKHIYYR